MTSTYGEKTTKIKIKSGFCGFVPKNGAVSSRQWVFDRFRNQEKIQYR